MEVRKTGLLLMLLLWCVMPSRTKDQARPSERLLDAIRNKAERAYRARRHLAWTRCSDQPPSGRPSFNVPADLSADGPPPESGRGRRAAVRSKGSALLLEKSRGQWSGDQGHLPEYAFTVSVWCKPLGGQTTQSVLLEAEDLCSPFPGRGWSLGLHNPETAGERNIRFYFRLHQWTNEKETTLTSPAALAATDWTHVAVAFDGHSLAIYLNGAQVAITFSQSSPESTDVTCRSLRLGGDVGGHYRGRVDDLRIWNEALDKTAIQNLRFRIWPASSPVISDDFARLDSWDWFEYSHEEKYRIPVLVGSDVPANRLQPIQPKHNPCGYSACDSPEVSGSYRDQWTLRTPKVLRYRVVVLSEDDGSNPIVTKNQISSQHRYLLQAYKRFNISWELDEFHIRNSTLRRRSILLSCYASMVGNGQCDPECRHPSTGNDGGDCNEPARVQSRSSRSNQLRFDTEEDEEPITDDCLEQLLGNGVCDASCNVAALAWDDGDCCSDTDHHSTCFDPRHPNRSYMDVREFKSLLQLKNYHHINVLFAHWTNRDILGVATFPWEKNALTEFGGIVLQPSSFGREGQMSTLVHELGHVLGLWHVHRGVSEMDCSHPCFEDEPSSLLGDLCGDTRPTPENLHCQDPPTGAHSVCGRTTFTDTPYTNYMGYADDSCVKDFTLEQVSRMHCHIDLFYNSIRSKDPEATSSSTITPPLLLSTVSSSSESVTLSWIPPLEIDAFYDSNACSSCSPTLQLSQYASRAETNEWGQPSSWPPGEITGPPDAEPCALSYKIWLPDTSRCPGGSCIATLYFDQPSVPSLLQLWVTWNARDGIRDVEVVYQDGNSEFFFAPSAQCDSPLSLPLFTNATLAKVRIRTAHRFVGIDAVRLVSTFNNPTCTPCKPLRYRIARDPPFPHGATREVDYPLFTDSDIRPGFLYSYSVQSWLGNKVTSYSHPLYHTAENAVCGNSVVDADELCDDGNVINGDGCSSSCQTEDMYHCTGSPSICYWHDSDGHCEPFERKYNPSDCGFYTPNGFQDQWTREVDIGPIEWMDGCSAQSVIGPPTLPYNCRADQMLDTSWTPCDFQLDTVFWIAAHFAKPVVATTVILYLTSDGDRGGAIQELSTSTLHLLSKDGIVHQSVEVRLSCRDSPQEIGIVKDLSLPFFETATVNLTFVNVQIEVAAIQLRSSNFLSPVEIAECANGDQYHPGLQKCGHYCKMPPCPKLHTKHANVSCTGTEDGDLCSVSCYPGHHRPNDLPPLVCKAGRWIGSDPNCKPLDCGVPSIAHADVICQEGTTYGRDCNYKCRPPARFIGGGSGLATIKCEADGKWSTPNAKCHLSCLSPTPPAHSVLASSRCRRASSFHFGQTCRFRCKAGYHVHQQSFRKRNMYLRCDIQGIWTGPDCVPVTCGAIEYLPNNCTAGNQFGSECFVLCPLRESVPSVHRCELDGTWNPPLPECRSIDTCVPPRIPGAEVQFTCQGQYVGAMCKATCSEQDRQLILNDDSSERLRLRCTHSGQWMPDPKEIQCKEKCSQKLLADGYCDGHNNKPHCAFDGGDCCSSTTPWRTPKRFSRDCGEACDCLDPQAEENM